jgi:hypothetical protein
MKSTDYSKQHKADEYANYDKQNANPIKDILEIGGSLKTTKKPLSNEQIHEMFGDYVVQVRFCS